MTNKNAIDCPQCGANIYNGLFPAEPGSFHDCHACGYTVSIKADEELSIHTPTTTPTEDTPGDDNEAGLETLPPIDELPVTEAEPHCAPAQTPKSKGAEVEAPPGAANRTPTRETFVFTGKAGEYFKIWIVNIALTIVTLGIYSAWAKVRNNRYFYGNTRLMGSTFEYHADPVKILKGRVLVFVLFGLYNLANHFMPIAGIVLYISFIFLLPWFIIKSMKFRARNSSYRNIRFNFEATYREALNTFVGYAIASTISLGILYPLFVFKRKEFTIGKSRYGTSPFNFKAMSWSYYKIYLMAFILILIMIILIILSTLLGIEITKVISPEGSSPTIKKVLGFTPMILLGTLYLFIFAFLKTAVDNLSLSSSSIGSSRLESNMRVRKMLWLYISNAVLIISTLGLMTPWAKIRMKRYKIEHLHLHVGTDFDAFIADEQKESSTFGEEALDFMDFDIGL